MVPVISLYDADTAGMSEPDKFSGVEKADPFGDVGVSKDAAVGAGAAVAALLSVADAVVPPPSEAETVVPPPSEADVVAPPPSEADAVVWELPLPEDVVPVEAS